jgi:hypothetical protein
LLLSAFVDAAPITADKLGLIPGLWRWERRALVAEVTPLLQKGEDIRPALLAAKVNPAVVKRLAEVDSGPLLVERYAHGLVFLAKGLTPQQKALFERVVPATETAQRALWKHREKLAAAATDPTIRKQVTQSHDVQIRQIEKRFWRVVAYVLGVEQRASIKRLYPHTYSSPPDIVTHVYQLPKLSAGQAGRVRALVTEYTSETAADSAANVLVHARLADPKLPAAERTRLQAEAEKIGDRVARVLKAIIEESNSIFTREQIVLIDALVPMLTTRDRAIHPGDLLKGIVLRPEQATRAHELGRELAQTYRETQKRLQSKLGQMEAAGLGSDSPQSMMMQGMRANTHAEHVAAMDAVAREILLDVLSPAQVADWVVAP